MASKAYYIVETGAVSDARHGEQIVANVLFGPLSKKESAVKKLREYWHKHYANDADVPFNDKFNKFYIEDGDSIWTVLIAERN